MDGAAAHAHGVDVATPRIGESFLPSQFDGLGRWWPEVPWEGADVAPVLSSSVDELLAAYGVGQPTDNA